MHLHHCKQPLHELHLSVPWSLDVQSSRHLLFYLTGPPGQFPNDSSSVLLDTTGSQVLFVTLCLLKLQLS
jgi:hypothetical protein